MSLLVKRNGRLIDPLPALEDFFNRDLFNWSANNSSTNTNIPAVNIKETGNSFQVEMAAPGMKKEDFNISLEGNTLTISSERRNENEEKEGEKYTRKEFSYQSFYRTFHLPKDVVDSENIRATYEHGLLCLEIPKREEAKQKPPRQIQIS
jgi:HSP20 family protein